MFLLFTCSFVIITIFTINKIVCSSIVLKQHVQKKMLTRKYKNSHLITMIPITDAWNHQIYHSVNKSVWALCVSFSKWRMRPDVVTCTCIALWPLYYLLCDWHFIQNIYYWAISQINFSTSGYLLETFIWLFSKLEQSDCYQVIHTSWQLHDSLSTSITIRGLCCQKQVC